MKRLKKNKNSKVASTGNARIIDKKDLVVLPKWKKIKGGIHYHTDGQVVKRGQFFYAFKEDIPKAFRKKFRLVRGAKKGTKQLPERDTETESPKGLEIMQSLKKGKFDIVNEAGDAINDNPLTKKEAETFLLEYVDEDENEFEE